MINDHSNDLGDWCPWSNTPAGRVDDPDAFACPAMCRDSGLDDD